MGFAGTKGWEGGHEESMARMNLEPKKIDHDKLREEVVQLKSEIKAEIQELKELMLKQIKDQGN